MRVPRRLALWGVLPLVLALVAAWTWYRVSDTGKRWRYEDHLASYCAGLLPPTETAVLTGLRTDFLNNDQRSGSTKTYHHFCPANNWSVTVSRVPEGEHDGLGPDDVQFFFPDEDAYALPATYPLGGGWRGYTDVGNTVASLSCKNGGSVVVTAQGEGYEGENLPVNRDLVENFARLVTATAARAADRWGCVAKAPSGGPRIPAMTHSPVPAAGVRDGTCAGLPLHRYRSINWAWGTRTDRNTLVERCVLSASKEDPGEQVDDEKHIYALEARYGPQALAEAIAQREWSDATNNLRDRFRATAQCPGSPALARFSVIHYLHKTDEKTAVALLQGFVRRAAERHGCTDVRLPLQEGGS
ncbi:hypothetical protein [Streptomyces ureilyticus]|uniref:Uncharacterized protein n=1 Tax=Streptomyces ureilyticus TaxID=1775131 RepID=A0ABX0DZC6_9ACTN|nr:hypothetical protein [Streptomyces ureilyticus]NGO47286.1 hypothetical protein [Streptomyces ureilyticus]